LKIFDLLVLVALLITAFGGYRSGLIQTVFKTIGYIAGGILGVTLSSQVLRDYSEVRFKLIAAIILIFLLAILGEFILGRISSLFRKTLFILPFKFIDSFLGAALSIARTVFIIYLLLVVLLSAPINIEVKYITNSKFYTYADSYLPEVITDLKVKAEQLFN